MAKLKVKNFGPLKNIDIELKQYNFFIGPPAVGKSAILKLLYLLNTYPYELFFLLPFYLDIEGKSKNISHKELKSLFYKHFIFLLEEIGISNFWDSKNTYIEYEYDKHKLIIIEKSDLKIYIRNKNISSTNLMEFIKQESEPTQPFDINYFVPTERAYILFIQNKPFESGNFALTNLLRRYGETISKYSLKIPKNKFFIPVITTHLKNKEGELYIEHQHKTLPLKECASGWQNIIEILLPLLQKSKFKNVFIEEPEISLFPQTQYDLVKELISLCSKKNLYITTHSPYILASMNNLLYASNISTKYKKKTLSVLKLKNTYKLPHIKQTTAYWLENGNCKSMIDDELKEIKIDELDGVSEIINQDYDKLINLKNTGK